MVAPGAWDASNGISLGPYLVPPAATVSCAYGKVGPTRLSRCSKFPVDLVAARFVTYLPSCPLY